MVLAYGSVALKSNWITACQQLGLHDWWVMVSQVDEWQLQCYESLRTLLVLCLYKEIKVKKCNQLDMLTELVMSWDKREISDFQHESHLCYIIQPLLSLEASLSLNNAHVFNKELSLLMSTWIQVAKYGHSLGMSGDLLRNSRWRNYCIAMVSMMVITHWFTMFMPQTLGIHLLSIILFKSNSLIHET